MTHTLARISLVTIRVSWILFILSFFLPATNILNWAGTPPGTPLTGWQTFTASMINGVINPLMWIMEPKVFLFLLFPFANGLMFLAVPLFSIVREEAIHLASFLLICAMVPWSMPTTLFGELFIGFYCWNASFFTMSLGYLLTSYTYLVDDQPS